MRVSFDYDDWRRILIAQDVEYLRCIIKKCGRVYD